MNIENLSSQSLIAIDLDNQRSHLFRLLLARDATSETVSLR